MKLRMRETKRFQKLQQNSIGDGAEDHPQESQHAAAVPPEPLDPNDSACLKDQIRGQTMEHATPPRLEDEGQSGG